MTWIRKFDYIGARRFEDILKFWAFRSPVGIEIADGGLAEHVEYISRDTPLPLDGSQLIGPVESRTLISELYCGVTKGFNLNFHAQTLAKRKAYTNGSIHSFNSLMQFMFSIMSIFGVFVIRIRGQYYVLDVFPWLGQRKLEKDLRKKFGNDWWRYARVIADTKQTIEQREIATLFKRCLRMTSVTDWRETVVSQIIDCDEKWFNRPRNNILYNFTGWTGSADLVGDVDCDVTALLRTAAQSIFDHEVQTGFGSLPQSLLLGSLLMDVWSAFHSTVVMEINGNAAPEFPNAGDPSSIGMIAEFEAALESLISDSAS